MLEHSVSNRHAWLDSCSVLTFYVAYFYFMSYTGGNSNIELSNILLNVGRRVHYVSILSIIYN